MINFSKYDVIVVKFPFASSLKYKARPAVIISSKLYNENKRDTLLICAISSKVDSKITYEEKISDWNSSGLLKESIFKASIVTIEKSSILFKLGNLREKDRVSLDKMMENIC